MACNAQEFIPLFRASPKTIERTVRPEPPVDLATQSKNIAAIDFGTSSSSLSFITAKADEVVTLSLGRHYRVRDLTAILLSRGAGLKVIVHSFGRSALKKHSLLGTDDLQNYVYFECFKMELRNSVTLEALVKDSQGQSYYLVEVIALVLKYFKDKLHEHLKAGSYKHQHFCCTDFEWVITVPAIWSDSSKEMMQEAALKAGLCSEKVEGIDFLSPPGQLSCATFGNEKKLQVVLEPECAAYFCQSMLSSSKAPYSDEPHPLSHTGTRYMVADIGGGTVDICILEVSSDNYIDSVIPPTGNEFGGCKVNEKFSSFLSTVIVKDENFKKFKEKVKSASGILSEMIYDGFEDEKISFGSNGYKKSPDEPDELIHVRIGSKFVKCYKEKNIEDAIKKLNDERVTFLDSDTIRITFPYLMDLIKDILEGIWKCAKHAIERANCQLDTIYLVGGFGGSRLIYEMFKERVKESFPLMDSLKFVVPSKHDLAVSQGAILYALDPSKIRSRVMNAHYGISLRIPFNSKHDEDYKVTNEDNEVFCQHVFCVYVLKGQAVCSNEAFTSTFIPSTSSQTSHEVEIYKTTRDDAYYVCDKEGKLIVEKVGDLIIEIPESSRQMLPRKERTTEVEMIFSDTTIKAKGTYIPTQEETKVQLKCL